MKKKILITAAVIGIVTSLGYIVPIVVKSANAVPLHGDYDMNLMCMGGHEIFLRLENEFAYEHCPGHRDKILIGRIIRDEASLIILDQEGEHFVRVQQDGDDLTVERLIWPKEPTILQLVGKRKIKQVNNPWRTWFPRMLPEH